EREGPDPGAGGQARGRGGRRDQPVAGPFHRRERRERMTVARDEIRGAPRTRLARARLDVEPAAVGQPHPRVTQTAVWPPFERVDFGTMTVMLAGRTSGGVPAPAPRGGGPG